MHDPLNARSKTSCKLKAIAVGLIVVLGTPLAIFAAYVIGEATPLASAPWSAGDSLAYCGAIVASLIAIAGVYWSLKETRRAQEDQIREEGAPFFSVIVLEQQNRLSAFGQFLAARHTEENQEGQIENSQSPDMSYREVDNRAVYALLGDDISYVRKLNNEQLNIVQSVTLGKAIGSGIETEVANPVIYMPLQLKNVGKGAAIGVRVGINPKDCDWSGVKSWTVEPGEHVYIGVYVNTEKEGVFGKYQLRVVFSDCTGYQYMQSFDLNVTRDDTENSGGPSVPKAPSVQISFIGARKVLCAEHREAYLRSVEKLRLPHK